MAEFYPFQWRENSKEDQERRAKFWTGHTSLAVHSVISTPMELNMPKAFVEKNIHKRIWNMASRPNDIWLVTYPKSGTTMGQELLWQMSTGCTVNSEESKKPILQRSPFIEFGGLTKGCQCDECAKLPRNTRSHLLDPITHAESLNSPRILKSHLPVSMLPPNVLDVAKVVVIARNVKDVCVSFYHHEKLMKQNHAWDPSATFEDYVKFFIEGKPGLYGNYWEHLKVCCK